MKHIFSILVTLFFTAAAYAQTDYNFNFYPAQKFARYTEQYVTDTLSKNQKLVADSTSQAMACMVEKSGEVFTIRSLANVSSVIYSAKVSFKGTLNDGKNSLFYRAESTEQESIIVNPASGYVVVIFQKCQEKPGGEIKPGEPEKQCNTVSYYFGNIALKAYK